MDNDVLEMFKSDDEPFEEANKSVEETTQSNKGNDNNVNIADRKDYHPLTIDIGKFNRTGKSFAVFVPNETDIPEEYSSKLKNIVKSLTENGYTLRVNCDSNNHVNELVKDAKNVNYYLPWGKFNEKVEKYIRPDFISYRIGLGLRKTFFDLSSGVRAIIASSVQVLLGKKCTDPVNFIIVYSPSGADTSTEYKDIKVDQEKNLFTIIQIANKAGLLYFNIKNEDAINKLKEVIKNSS